MKPTTTLALLTLSGMLLICCACDSGGANSNGGGAGKAADAPLSAPADPVADLKKHMKALHDRQLAGKGQEASAALLGMAPDEARLRRGLAENAPAESVNKILAMYEAFRKETPPEEIADKGNTEVLVHGATTEEIAKNAEGTTAFKEFPGGAREAASSGLLRPGMTYYEVEFVKPGEDLGMKFHLFYWDGTGWSMLGPVWRALK